MDFKTLVGSKVKVTARIHNIGIDRTSNNKMIVLEDVYVNEVYFRDHAWVRYTKRFRMLHKDDIFTAAAVLINYNYSNDTKLDKFGLKSFRSVRVVE